MTSIMTDTCFVATAPLLKRQLFIPQLPPCNRRCHAHSASHARRSVFKMAKFQPKKTSSERPEDERPLEQILPPPALPTLTTLTGETTFSSNQSADGDESQDAEASEGDEVMQMGVGLSTAQENAIVTFFLEIAEEFKMIEWPSFGRIIRLSIIVLFTIIVATASLYVVDGFFYRVSQALFQGNL